jgi:Cu-Zn family superoxide dismutase
LTVMSVVISLSFVGGPVAAAPAAQPELHAWAALTDTAGREVGVATFTEDAEGVHVEVRLNGLPPGTHGIHIHEVGRCNLPTFAGAGGHFNPGRREHGMHDAQGMHAGDLPNLQVDPDGTAMYTTVADSVTLGFGNPAASLFDGNGSALVIHTGADDYVSNPDGNSGARIACGEILPA